RVGDDKGHARESPFWTVWVISGPAPHGGAFWPKSSDYTLQRSPRCNSVVHRKRRSARMARRDDREYREYLREEQRGQPGWIVVRMPIELNRGLCLQCKNLIREQKTSSGWA